MRSSFTSDTGLKLTRTPSARQLAYRRRLSVVLALALAGGLLGVFAVPKGQTEAASAMGPFSYFPS